MANDKVCCGLYVVVIEVAIGHAELIGHDNWIADFIQLCSKGIGRKFSVEQTVTRHRAVCQLLVIEEVIYKVMCCLQVSVKVETRPSLIKVACENLAIGTKVAIVRITS